MDIPLRGVMANLVEHSPPALLLMPSIDTNLSTLTLNNQSLLQKSKNIYKMLETGA